MVAVSLVIRASDHPPPPRRPDRVKEDFKAVNIPITDVSCKKINTSDDYNDSETKIVLYNFQTILSLELNDPVKVNPILSGRMGEFLL